MSETAFANAWSSRRATSTPLGWAVVAIGMGLIAVGSVSDHRWVLLFGSLFLGARIAARLTIPRTFGASRVCFIAPSRCALGDAPGHQFHLHNDSSLWTPRAWLEVETEGFVPFGAAIPPIPPGGVALPSVKREAIRRTAVDVHALSLTWTDWMGLNRAKIQAECERSLVVHPRVSRVEVERYPSGDGERPGRRVDRSGSEAFALREWRAGDPVGDVHWRSSARRGQFVVVERAQPRADDLLIVVIGDGETPMPEPTVALVAATALASQQQGRRVTLGGAQVGLLPLTGGTRTDILDWCARVDTPDRPRDALIEQLFLEMGGDDDVRFAIAGELSLPWWERVAGIAGRCGVRCTLVEDKPVPAVAAGGRR